MSDPNLSSFIWSVADLLRGDYKQSEYGKVILPFTVLRRLDCVLEGTKEAVLKELAVRQKAGLNPEPFLLRKSGQLFFNTSLMDMKRLMGDQDHIKENLFAYIQAFSPAVRDIFECFDFHTQVDRLAKAGLLYLVAEKFANIDLHPEAVSNAQMGLVFEEMISKFAEISNETAGEHFTPREVIRLMVNLLFIEDDEGLTKPGIVRSMYDPTAGTGGMLSGGEEHLRSQNPDAGGLDLRVWPDSVPSRRQPCRTRAPQLGLLLLDGRRRREGGDRPRQVGRVRHPAHRRSGPHSRSSRHYAASARHRSQTSHLPPRRSRLSPDRHRRECGPRDS